MDFKINAQRDRVWYLDEAEKELRARGYTIWYASWIEGDSLVYLIEPTRPGSAAAAPRSPQAPAMKTVYCRDDEDAKEGL